MGRPPPHLTRGTERLCSQGSWHAAGHGGRHLHGAHLPLLRLKFFEEEHHLTALEHLQAGIPWTAPGGRLVYG
jgi:hypothetical protein